MISEKQLSDGFSIPVYGLGTWEMGGHLSPDYTHDDADLAAIIAAIENGVRHIDTAEIYSGGHSEELVGQAAKRVGREQLFIATKVHPTHAEPEQVIASCHASLERLGMEYVDLYMPHGRNTTVPLDETMGAIDALVDDGLVRHVGLSNFGTQSLQEAQAVTRSPIRVDQVFYNILYRAPESDGLLKYCQENDVLLNAYRPVERGVLIDNPPAVVSELAATYQKTPAQICINWLITQPNVITLSKTRSVKHLEENLGALDWSLSDSDVERMRSEVAELPSNGGGDLR